jgi:hypothetical protein
MIQRSHRRNTMTDANRIEAIETDLEVVKEFL